MFISGVKEIIASYASHFQVTRSYLEKRNGQYYANQFLKDNSVAFNKVFVVGFNAWTEGFLKEISGQNQFEIIILADKSEYLEMNASKYVSELYKFISFEDALYEELDAAAYFITTENNIYKKVSLLLDWGVQLSNIQIFDLKYNRGTKPRDCYDINLGLTREDAGNGFTVFSGGGQLSEVNCIIVALGGSTTDVTCSGLTSWPEMLYGRLKERGFRSIAVIAGGMGNYSSSQEILQLIRDVIPLEPSIVISYGGFNDIRLDMLGTYFKTNDRYNSEYQLEVLENALKHRIIKSPDKRIEIKKCVGGNNIHRNAAKHWLANERMMGAACEELGIHFRGYLQPCRPYEEYRTGIGNLEEHQKYADYYEEIKNEFPLRHVKDISNLFDGNPNIYMDSCHVFENGNRMIADTILNDIVDLIGEKI